MELGLRSWARGRCTLDSVRVGDTASDAHPVTTGATWSSTGSESACAVRQFTLSAQALMNPALALTAYSEHSSSCRYNPKPLCTRCVRCGDGAGAGAQSAAAGQRAKGDTASTGMLNAVASWCRRCSDVRLQPVLPCEWQQLA